MWVGWHGEQQLPRTPGGDCPWLLPRAILFELPLTRDKDAEISAGAMAATCHRQA